MTGQTPRMRQKAPPPLEIRARPFGRRNGTGPAPTILSRIEQTDLIKIATAIPYPKGGITVFTEGEEIHYLYVVAQGALRISRHLEGGRRQVLAFMWPGDVCGLAEQGHHINSAETLTPALLYRIPIDHLRRLLSHQPRLQLHLLAKAAHELRAAQRQIILLGQPDMTSRVAAFILDLCQQFHYFDARSADLRLPMTRFDIADYLGTTPETVTRAFTRLEEGGVILRLSPKHLQIRSMPKLMALSR